MIEHQSEQCQCYDGAEHQSDPGHRHIDQRPPPCHVGEGQVEAEAVDDGVDLEVDGQAVHDPGQDEDLLLVKVDGEEDGGHDDRLSTASGAHIHDQWVVEPQTGGQPSCGLLGAAIIPKDRP